jgi:flagellar biosynthesis/type III secretory pathway chaperone
MVGFSLPRGQQPMKSTDNLAKNSDSLIDLLGAQCSDLEKLLALARDEAHAAEDGKFLRIWEIVTERATIAERLETYQRQISELRGHLESRGESVSQYDITNRVIELANLTLAQDQRTRKLLSAMREESVAGQNNLERSMHGANAYMRETTKGLACDRDF